MEKSSTSAPEAHLRVAVVKDGETFPHLCAPFTLRTGNLARELAGRGHDVTWYSSTFMHNEKQFYSTEDTIEERDEGYRMHLLDAGGYRRNISLARWGHHARLACRVYATLKLTPSPDVVVCMIPILEVAMACLLFCRKRKIPLILDIQDPWPRVFVDYAPRVLKPLVRAALAPYFLAAGQLFGQANSLVACSEGFLAWAQKLGSRAPRSRGMDKVVYHGAHQVANAVAPENWVPTSGLRSIYMGAFAGIYDLDPIADLIEKQAERGDSHHVFFVGQGGDRYDRLRQRLAGLGNVTFTGWMPREQVYALAQTCHLGWLPLTPGTEDFMPNKPFEYAAIGLAIATSSQGEAGRLVESRGLGFRYRSSDPEDLLLKVSALQVDSEDLRNWRSRGLEFSRFKGNAEVCAGQFADHIERVVALHRRPKVRVV